MSGNTTKVIISKIAQIASDMIWYLVKFWPLLPPAPGQLPLASKQTQGKSSAQWVNLHQAAGAIYSLAIGHRQRL